MRQIRPKSISLGLALLLLGPVILLGGCGESGSSPLVGQDAPKNRMEGLKRMEEASLKHDLAAPANKRSGVPKS